MARNCGCAGASCGCKIISGGNGVTIYGIGTADDPYIIVAEIGQLSQVITFADSASVNFTVSGEGTQSDPMLVTAITIPAPFPVYTTAGRPSAASVGIGAFYWDTTLGQALWSDGATWRVPGGQYQTVNAQTGTTYTPVLADRGSLVTLTNAAGITVTLPQDSAVAFPVGSSVDFVGLGAGLITFAAGSGATKVPAAAVSRAQYSAMSAIKIAANSWLVVGDLA